MDVNGDISYALYYFALNASRLITYCTEVIAKVLKAVFQYIFMYECHLHKHGGYSITDDGICAYTNLYTPMCMYIMLLFLLSTC